MKVTKKRPGKVHLKSESSSNSNQADATKGFCFTVKVEADRGIGVFSEVTF